MTAWHQKFTVRFMQHQHKSINCNLSNVSWQNWIKTLNKKKFNSQKCFEEFQNCQSSLKYSKQLNFNFPRSGLQLTVLELFIGCTFYCFPPWGHTNCCSLSLKTATTAEKKKRNKMSYKFLASWPILASIKWDFEIPIEIYTSGNLLELFIGEEFSSRTILSVGSWVIFIIIVQCLVRLRMDFKMFLRKCHREIIVN